MLIYITVETVADDGCIVSVLDKDGVPVKRYVTTLGRKYAPLGQTINNLIRGEGAWQ